MMMPATAVLSPCPTYHRASAFILPDCIADSNVVWWRCTSGPARPARPKPKTSEVAGLQPDGRVLARRQRTSSIIMSQTFTKDTLG